MKKILASILVLTMLVCCMSISAFADSAPATITIEDATATAGKTVQFPVNVVVTGDFAAVKFTLSTNLEGATITAIEQGMWTLNNSSAFENNPANGETVWGNKVNVNLETKGEGTICTYILSIPENAVNGTYEVKLECIDYCFVDAANNDKVTTIEGLTTTDTAVLTVEGGVDAPVHEHDFSGAWEKDATDHWKVCAADGEIAEKAAHAYDNDQDADCNVCGATREVEPPHEHVPGTEYGKDADNHWNTCECGEKVNVEAHVYDDAADVTCNTCGYERHIHTAGTEYGSDKDNHWNTCECGEKVNVEAHVYADDADTTCDTCGYERTLGGNDGDKDEGKDDTTETGDSTNLFIYMAICLFAAAAIVVTSYKLKKSRG